MTPQESANQAMAASLQTNNLSQMMPMHQPSPPALGCSSSTQRDVLSVQLLSNPLRPCHNSESMFQRQHPSVYPGRPLLTKDLTDMHGSGVFLNHSATPPFMCYENHPQPIPVLSHGNFMQAGMHVLPSSPVSYPTLQPSRPVSFPTLQQSLTTRIPASGVFDPGCGCEQECFAEEKHSSNDKSSGSSSKSQTGLARWRPNDHQLELLEQYFESGATRPTAELHAAVQGCGNASENNVNVWLKNRASRRKKHGGKKDVSIRRHLHDEESDDDTPWEDFRVASQTVMNALTGAVSQVQQSDAYNLAHAIQEARNICCFGVGKGALVMKSLASGLHHLGFDSFFVDDTNVPRLDNKSLALISAGPGSSSRTSGMIDEVISAGSRVIVFATYKLPDSERIYTILIPSHPQIPLHLSSDGEVVSPIPDPPQDTVLPSTLFDLSLTLLCECVCVMLKRAGDMTPGEMRARHTNLE